ncbi:MAG: hypothetical protein KDD33_04650 [Bdellovibrionales bacterium]|nr:hypothetical protein [Bdellovibrionales bacterium]
MGIMKAFYTFWGVFMGTTVDYVKPEKRPLWPSHVHDVDQSFSYFLGGSGNCGVLKNGKETLLINCNSGVASQKLKDNLSGQTPTLIATSTFPDYIGGANEFSFTKIITPRDVSETIEIQWGDETVVIEPVEATFSEKDIVVYLKNRKVLFLGGLFYNGIHPIIDSQRGLNPKNWVETLQALVKKYQPSHLVPHEGDVCEAKKLQGFVDYLQSLSDSAVEFSLCREKFDWPEIPGYTSLEENFDLLRNR